METEEDENEQGQKQTYLTNVDVKKRIAKEKCFVSIPNTFAQAPGLKPGIKAAVLYLLSLPESKVGFSRLAKVLKISRSNVSKIIVELGCRNILVYEKVKKDDGGTGCNKYYFYAHTRWNLNPNLDDLINKVMEFKRSTGCSPLEALTQFRTSIFEAYYEYQGGVQKRDSLKNTYYFKEGSSKKGNTKEDVIRSREASEHCQNTHDKSQAVDETLSKFIKLYRKQFENTYGNPPSKSYMEDFDKEETAVMILDYLEYLEGMGGTAEEWIRWEIRRLGSKKTKHPSRPRYFAGPASFKSYHDQLLHDGGKRMRQKWKRDKEKGAREKEYQEYWDSHSDIPDISEFELDEFDDGPIEFDGSNMRENTPH